MWYVYVDYTLDQGKPFYVGKGNLARCKSFARNAKHTAIREKHGHDRRIVFETLCEQDAFEHEKYLIGALKTYQPDFPNTLACNFTRGGDGASGLIHSEQTRAVLRQKSLGVGKSPETIAKFRASSIGAKRSLEARLNMSEAAKGKIISPEQRAKIAASLRERARKSNV